MTYDQAMAGLKAGGSEQTRKTYARHGVDPATAFGVSYAIIYKLAKQAGADQPLAERLWASGNHDARVLATLVAEAGKITSSMLEKWLRDSRNYVQMDAVSTLAMRTPHASEKATAWIDSKDEYTAAAGWNMVGGLAMAGAPEGARGRVPRPEGAGKGWDDATLAKYLARIEREIASAKNRVKHSMNNALICIGLKGGAMRNAAIETARRIGKVVVDHGDTSCKTPDAIEYIQKVESRRKPAAKPAARPAPPKPALPSARKPAARKLAAARR